jgi:hypothetical protein
MPTPASLVPATAELNWREIATDCEALLDASDLQGSLASPLAMGRRPFDAPFALSSPLSECGTLLWSQGSVQHPNLKLELNERAGSTSAAESDFAPFTLPNMGGDVETEVGKPPDGMPDGIDVTPMRDIVHLKLHSLQKGTRLSLSLSPTARRPSHSSPSPAHEPVQLAVPIAAPSPSHPKARAAVSFASIVHDLSVPEKPVPEDAQLVAEVGRRHVSSALPAEASHSNGAFSSIVGEQSISDDDRPAPSASDAHPTKRGGKVRDEATASARTERVAASPPSPTTLAKAKAAEAGLLAMLALEEAGARSIVGVARVADRGGATERHGAEEEYSTSDDSDCEPTPCELRPDSAAVLAHVERHLSAAETRRKELRPSAMVTSGNARRWSSTYNFKFEKALQETHSPLAPSPSLPPPPQGDCARTQRFRRSSRRRSKWVVG